MRIYGYREDEQPSDTRTSAALAEVTLNICPAELRALAAFLLDCADEMERMGESFGHVHLADRMKPFASSPHVVVVRDQA